MNNSGLLTIHNGVCAGAGASAILTMLILDGRTLVVGLVLSLPYLLFALTATGYSDSRPVLRLLLGGVTLIGGIGTIGRCALVHSLFAQPASISAAAAAGKRVMNCGPPLELIAFVLLTALEYAGAIIFMFTAVGAYHVLLAVELRRRARR
jgi:hypothetical protein